MWGSAGGHQETGVVYPEHQVICETGSSFSAGDTDRSGAGEDDFSPESIKPSPIAGLILSERHRRWANIKLASLQLI